MVKQTARMTALRTPGPYEVGTLVYKHCDGRGWLWGSIEKQTWMGNRGCNMPVYLVEFEHRTEDKGEGDGEEKHEGDSEGVCTFEQWVHHSQLTVIGLNARKVVTDPSTREDELEKFTQEMRSSLAEELNQSLRRQRVEQAMANRGCMVLDVEHAPGHRETVEDHASDA